MINMNVRRPVSTIENATCLTATKRNSCGTFFVDVGIHSISNALSLRSAFARFVDHRCSKKLQISARLQTAPCSCLKLLTRLTINPIMTTVKMSCAIASKPPRTPMPMKFIILFHYNFVEKFITKMTTMIESLCSFDITNASEYGTS